MSARGLRIAPRSSLLAMTVGLGLAVLVAGPAAAQGAGQGSGQAQQGKVPLSAAMAAAQAAAKSGKASPLEVAIPADLVDLPGGYSLVEVLARPQLAEEGATGDERQINAAYVAALSDDDLGVTSTASSAPQEVSLREVAMKAVERNLTIQRARIGEDMARQALVQAEALFLPEFGANYGYSYSTDKFRQQDTTRYRTALVPCTQLLPGVNALRGRFCKFFRNGPIFALVYNGPRPAGNYPTTIRAHEESFFDSWSNSLNGFALQRLPWGQEVRFDGTVRYRNVHWVVNRDNPDIATADPYGRGWTTSWQIATFLPVPWLSRNWMEGYEARLQETTARLNVDAAAWSAKAAVNDALLASEAVYWRLVGAVMNHAQARRLAGEGEELLTRTRRLFDAQMITESDLAQVESQVAALRGRAAAAREEVAAASLALKEVLDLDGDAPMLPLGYLEMLERNAVLPDDPALTRENPAYRAALVNLHVAQAIAAARKQQQMPDVRLSASVNFRQSDGTFGYKNPYESLSNVFSPDVTTTTLGVNYTGRVMERQAAAVYEQAQAGLGQSEVIAQRVGLQLAAEFDNAHQALDSALARAAITKRQQDLAQTVYDKAAQFQASRVVSEYEITKKLLGLLGAQQAHIQARVAVKQAEARVLAAAGGLAERFAERTAFSDTDMRRVAALAESGAVSLYAATDRRASGTTRGAGFQD